ncbi:phosphatase PAP2 family protein [Phormidium sp. CCY1219]|uniref:phosphatase PAP2 family protein n=1 Tax=Phormidium sp. CCY1219 TaxID=2886104 RepID=UPI002D1F2796|nr:phosphatase PAP2 family protein [Phormidium sp. CCY1219]MEB3831540.1 phosphatase PAP2 family protein [Phormidium sp. CCY1219]
MKSKLISLISVIPLGGLLGSILCIWGFFEIAEEVLEQETTAMDTEVLLMFKDLHTPLLDRLVTAITFLGDPRLLSVVCFLLGIALVRRGMKAEATTIAIAAIGSVLLNTVLKKVFSRARPELWERILDVSSYSFPSGHALVSLVIYGIFGYLLSTQFPRWRVWVAIGTLGLIIPIGLSRLYLGVHWPTDIVAGYTAGMVWLMACIISLEIWRQSRGFFQGYQE